MSIGQPWQDEDGQWMVPTRVEADDTVGFAWVELTPDHPMYDEWRGYIQARTTDAWATRVSGTLGGDHGQG